MCARDGDEQPCDCDREITLDLIDAVNPPYPAWDPVQPTRRLYPTGLPGTPDLTSDRPIRSSS